MQLAPPDDGMHTTQNVNDGQVAMVCDEVPVEAELGPKFQLERGN